jgi:nitroreductase
MKGGIAMDYEGLLDLVKRRRSIRKFKPEPIPDEYVDKIIEVARWAPSGANSQPWEFIVIKNKRLRNKIIDFAIEQTSISYNIERTRDEKLRFFEQGGPPAKEYNRDAPVCILVCGDTRTKDFYPLIYTLTTGDQIFQSSLASAFLYMTLAATSLGLASKWLTAVATPLVEPLVKDLLGIPKVMALYDMMLVGYPASKPRPRPVRDAQDIVHYERYDKSKFLSEDHLRQRLVKGKAWMQATTRRG